MNTPSSKTQCAGCCTEPDCGCTKKCDEGRGCDRHTQEDMAYWASYFGISPGMSRLERMSQLEAFRPESDVTDEERAEWRHVKGMS